MDISGENLGQILTIGEHCSVEHCGQLDFLPFKCDCCSRTFCLEHRSYIAHACPRAGAKETTVIVCPICAKSVRLKPGEQCDEAFDAHQREDCDPANYAKVHKKARCPVGACKGKLTTVNAYRCKHCGQRVCLRHRDPGDHNCAEAQAALKQHQRSSSYASSSNIGGKGRTTVGTNSTLSPGTLNAPRATSTTTSTAGSLAGPTGQASSALPSRRLDPQQLHAAAVRQYDNPANSVRGTAARRQQLAAQAQQEPQQASAFQWPWQQRQPNAQFSQPQAPISKPSPLSSMPGVAPPSAVTTRANSRRNGNTSTSNANPLVPPHLPESCPQCGAKFATVERLIQHVEDFHPTACTGTARAASAAVASPAADFTNPLRGVLSGLTIAGGAAPSAAPAVSGVGVPYTEVGTGSLGTGAREVYRCYHCSRAFNDPVQLVHHAERCMEAAGASGARVETVGGAGAGGQKKDNCIIC